MKRCKDCQTEKPLTEFYPTKTGRQGHCKACNTVRCAKWRNGNEERHRSNALTYHFKSRYGLTLERYETMKAKGCSICGTMEELAVDHDHSCCSGIKTCGNCVRGMLCRRHNLAAGYSNDSPAELRALADYIERHALYLY